ETREVVVCRAVMATSARARAGALQRSGSRRGAGRIGATIEAQRAKACALVEGAPREAFEVPLGHFADVCSDPTGRFTHPLLAILQTTLPLDHRPGVVAVRRQLAEDTTEVHLAVAHGTKTTGPTHPVLEARVDPLLAGRIELGILDVERLDPLMVEI